MSFLGLSSDFEERGQEPVQMPHCMHLLKSSFWMAVGSVTLVTLQRLFQLGMYLSTIEVSHMDGA